MPWSLTEWTCGGLTARLVAATMVAGHAFEQPCTNPHLCHAASIKLACHVLRPLAGLCQVKKKDLA